MNAEPVSSSNPPDRPVSPGRLRPGRWISRLALAAIPVLVLIGIEAGLRLSGRYEDQAWSNPFADYEPGTEFFPAWRSSVSLPKPAGTWRVFSVGGSVTAGMGVDQPFADLLPGLLAARGVTAKVESVNGGVPAAGSHRVYEVIREAARYQPDLVVVCIGHNEFLESCFFDPNGVVARQERLARQVRRLRIVLALNRWLKVEERQQQAFKKVRLQQHFVGNTDFPLIRSDAQYRHQLRLLEANVETMIDFARAHGFRLLFMPEVANLGRLPGNSTLSAGCKDPERFKALFLEGRDRLQRRDLEGAVDCLTNALALGPEFALAHHLLGQAYYLQGRRADALREFLASNQNDRRGDVVNPDIRHCILDTARANGVPALDIEPLFFERPPVPGGIFGSELFLDHCHPGAEGHRLIAEALADFMVTNRLINVKTGGHGG